jgi:rod shape-determining protein MreB and related proteins
LWLLSPTSTLADEGDDALTDTLTTTIDITIRAGTSTLRVQRGDELVSTEVIEVGGDDVDSAIIEHVRGTSGVVIGPRTAERIKLDLGAAPQMTIKGRSVATGVPAEHDVMMDDVQRVALLAMEPLAQRLRATTAGQPRPPSELRLAGGGALLSVLDQHLRRMAGITAPTTSII